MGPPDFTVLFRALAGDRTALLYRGSFSDAHTARFLELVELLLGHGDAPPAYRSSMAFVLVEAYQNIVRYARDRGTRSLVGIRRWEVGAEVLASNPLSDGAAAELMSAIGRLDGLGSAQLKALFLDGLRSGSRTREGGAGLGLIEMKRRSKGGMWHEFVRLPEGGQRFSMALGMDAARPPVGTGPLTAALEAIGDLHHLLLLKGSFCPVVQMEVARIIEQEALLVSSAAVPQALRSAAVMAALASTEELPGDPNDRGMAWYRTADEEGLAIAAWMSHGEADTITALVERLTGPGDPARAVYRDVVIGRSKGVGRTEAVLADLLRHAVGEVRCTRSVLDDRCLVQCTVPLRN